MGCTDDVDALRFPLFRASRDGPPMIAYYLTPAILLVISLYLIVYLIKNYIIKSEEVTQTHGHDVARSMGDEAGSSEQDTAIAKTGLAAMGDAAAQMADDDAPAPIKRGLVSLGSGGVTIARGRDGSFDGERPEEVGLPQEPLSRGDAVVDPDVLLAVLLDKLASDERQYKDGNNSFVDKPHTRFEYKRVEFKVRDGR